jgi:nucleotidyltransferase AbiEii toxin of type IV toxin-antitoxin system
MPSMRLHPDILTSRQRRVIRWLGPLLTFDGFYLAGGTCVAIRLGHRRSVDLDWFLPSRFQAPHRLEERLRQAGIAFQIERIERGTLLGRVSGVRVSLLEYTYPILSPPTKWNHGPCRLASVPDLAAMKLSAIAQRGSKKDFVDLHALIGQGISLPRMLAWYQQKYRATDTSHVVYSLLYFADADAQRMPHMRTETNWRAVKHRIRQWVQNGIR